MTRTQIAGLAAFTILAVGCGGDDDAGTGTADVAAPVESGGDTEPATIESGQDIADDAPVSGEGSTVNISGGTGTLTIGLPDGRTENRDVECSIYSDQFEVTFEYSDILDDDQSVTFYYREEGDEISDVSFTFQDPQLGGLAAYNTGTASSPAISGSTLSVDLNVLIVGSTDAVGNPEMTDVSVAGTCAA